MKKRVGFVSNSSSTSFIIYSEKDLKDREVYDSLTDHDHIFYDKVYNQILKPEYDGEIIVCGMHFYIEDLPSPFREELMNKLQEISPDCHAYIFIDERMNGIDRGLQSLFKKGSKVFAHCLGME